MQVINPQGPKRFAKDGAHGSSFFVNAVPGFQRKNPGPMAAVSGPRFPVQCAGVRSTPKRTLADSPKQEAPAGGLIPREETSQAEASGMALPGFHPTTIIHS